MTATTKNSLTPEQFRRVLYVPGARGVVRYAEALFDFQKADFAALDKLVMALAAGKQPEIGNHWIERTKGADKSGSAAVEILWLAIFSPRMLLIQIAAGDEEQADEIRKVIKSILKLPENRWITKHLTVLADRIVNDRTETEIHILTTDALGSHGARPNLVVIDEVSHQKNFEFIDTLLDNRAKMPFGGLLCLTNAGFLLTAAHKLRELARTSRRWFFSSYDRIAPWLDPLEIAERVRLIPKARADRLYRGRWVTGTDDGLSPDDIETALVLAGPHHAPRPGWSYFVGADLGFVSDHSAVLTVGVDPVRKKIVLAECQAWRPPRGGRVDGRAVRSYLKSVFDRFHSRNIYIDPTEARVMIQDLAAMGVSPVTEYTFSSRANRQAMASAVLSAFRDQTIELFPDPELIDELHRIAFVDHETHFELFAERDARGHCDRAISLAIVLVPAINFLRYGEFEAGASMPKHFDARARGVQIGAKNEPAADQRVPPLQSRHGIQLSAQASGWDAWNRRPLAGGRRGFASCVQLSRK
jgi:hypothetical protein